MVKARGRHEEEKEGEEHGASTGQAWGKRGASMGKHLR